MRETKIRAALGSAVVVLSLAGFVAARAADGSAPSAGQLGNVWEADPPYAPAGALATATWLPPAAAGNAGATVPDDLPQGIPDAARVPEPELPTPSGWAFGDGFPRTSGTGRYANGAYFWSDFIYDDNGAIGPAAPTNESTGAPGFGTYKYPEPAANRNGSDIFRVAIGRSGDATTWRVDWNTLTGDGSFPIAEFTVDSDNNPSTGVAAWPANAGLKSAGIDWAIVISSGAARVINLATNESTPLTAQVDLGARSFMVTTTAIPMTSPSAVVRVASGIAGGESFKTLDADHGAGPGQPNVYNVAYRDYADEPSQTNTWYDTGQAAALTAGGDVSVFAATVNWNDLANRTNQPETLLEGATNRWYVSSIELGQGVVDPGQGISVNGPAAYVGRVQPYQIYVPTTYDPKTPSSLTWMLHGASASHNSAQVSPRYLESACERRNSICVSPLGRGPSGGWRTYAELDFWEVWNRVASAYTLDPKRTILTGISMGAFGTYKIAMDHPEAFEAAVAIVGNATGAETGLDRLTNLRWMQLYARHGAADELVPITTEIDTQNALNALGLRHVYDFQPAEDHIAVALKDAYDDVAEFMAGVDKLDAVSTPAQISFALTPQGSQANRDFEAAHKINRPGAWWVQGVAKRDDSQKSRVEATSFAIPNPPHNVVERDEPRALGSPSPTLRHVLEWSFTESAPPTERRLDAALTNVGAVTIDLAQAGLASGDATLMVTTDGPVTITLGSAGKRKVTVDGQKTKAGSFTVSAGTHVITVG